MNSNELDKIINNDNLFASGGKKWIQKAVNPKHKGYCTPMTKSTCTPRRKAFAMTMKKHHGFHADGGDLNDYTEGMKDHGGELIDGYNTLLFLGGLTGATAISGGADVAGQLSGVINPNTKGGGAASGALKGASMGASLGPYGMAAGALIGGAAGFINSKNQQNRANFAKDAADMKERNQLLGIKASGGKLILPIGVSPNMTSEYEEGGLIFNSNVDDSIFEYKLKDGRVLKFYNK